MDENHSAGSEIQRPRYGRRSWPGSEPFTLEIDVYVWRYALLVVLARNDNDDDYMYPSGAGFLTWQESLANAKGNAWQQCMFEGASCKQNLSSPILAMDIGNNTFTYARWRHLLAWLLPYEWPNASILERVPKFDARHTENSFNARGKM